MLSEIPKSWATCTQCPMNYDGLDCHVYKERYESEYDETFDPYNEIPKWCEVKSIRFYDERLNT